MLAESSCCLLILFSPTSSAGLVKQGARPNARQDVSLRFVNKPSHMMTSNLPPAARPMSVIEARFRQSQQEFQDHRSQTEHIQAELKEELDVLRAQEGWDHAATQGVNEWISDSSSIFRALRRYRYDAQKTVQSLLSVAQRRVDRALHGPLPTSSPYCGSKLFYILPLPQFMDRLRRPVAVLSIREVVRDTEGSLDDMKEWLWWALEMTRRVMRDWWTQGVFSDSPEPLGRGGEGCVLLVDAAAGGYRNLEVELLPTLLSVGHNDFPGLFETVFVVNAGWGQRSMWSIVKRVLPRSALDKILFLDRPEDIAAAFELNHLPKAFGGSVEYTHDFTENEFIRRYSQQPSYEAPIAGPSRIDSCSTMADIFYTARNTPTNSAPLSRRSSLGNVNSGLISKLKMSSCTAQESAPESGPSSRSSPDPSSGQSSPASQDPGSHVQAGLIGVGRVKSLADFHLYLSPSRLAHIDLLSDSDGEGSTPQKTVPLLARRRTLRPAILEQNLTSRAGILATQTSRPPLRLHGIPKHVIGEMDARSYSNQLQRHHAEGLDRYAVASPPPVEALDRKLGASPGKPATLPDSTDAGDSASLESGTKLPQVESESTPPNLAVEGSQDISAYATNWNPWFGYPAIRVPDPNRPGASSVRPRYARNRKRDLVKTLIFLFLIRLQSIRDAIERFLRLDQLGSLITGRAHLAEQRLGPAQGLLESAKERQTSVGQPTGQEMMQTKEKDWVWMIIGFLLLRGTWMGMLTAPLDALGLEGVKGLLGLT